MIKYQLQVVISDVLKMVQGYNRKIEDTYQVFFKAKNKSERKAAEDDIEFYETDCERLLKRLHRLQARLAEV